MNAVAQSAYPATPLEHALAYAALGFKVFPLHAMASGRCTCGDADCRSPAKHPRTLRGAHDAACDEAAIRAWWTQWPDANIGMTLEGLAVVDVDPRNGGDDALTALQAKHGRLPETATALTGGGGQHYLYRVAESRRLPGKLGDGIDLKHGPGAYIVVAPSIHASGVAYCWEASADLLDGFPLTNLPDWIGEQASTTSPPPRVVGLLDAKRKRDLRGALAYIDADDRDNWITVGMALHSTEAADAFAVWTEWSQLSPKYNPGDQRRVWNSFHPDGKTHVETIFRMAERAGWVNPDSRESTRYNDALEAAIAAANARTHVEAVEEKPQVEIGPFPAPALNELSAWIDARFALTHPAVTRQITLALAAVAASRNYVGEGGTPCHLCLGIVADSAALTAYARDAVSLVLDACGLRRMARGTRANVPSNVYTMLWRSPAAIHVVNDFGHLAAYAKRQPSGVLDQVFSVMAEAHTAVALYLDSAAEIGLKPGASDDQLVIHAPALTTLLLSTTAQMGALLQKDEISRGLLAWQLPVIARTGSTTEKVPSSAPLPQSLRDHLRAVRRLPAGTGELSLQDIFGTQPGLLPRVTRIRWERPFDEYADAIRAISKDPAHRVVLMTAVDAARRIANALAPWRDPAAPVATREVMDWAAAYVIRLMGDWLEEYDTLGTDDGIVGIGQKVVAAVRDRKGAGIPRGRLHAYCRAYKQLGKDRRAQVLDALLEDGDLVEFAPRGQRAKVLVHSKFAKTTKAGDAA